MVRELLDFTQSRIGSGIPVDLAQLDLHQFMSDHLGPLSRAHPGRQLNHRSQGAGACEADASRLAQLTDNLVNNAVAYGDPDEPITITTTIRKDCFSIAVHNRGVPIPPPVLARIFEPMVRGYTSGAHSSGVGLGLYIVRQIARAHAGDVEVHSSAEQGTTFTANFPR